MITALRENIDWVGYVDWTVRDFHGYSTNRGSTYNAYLVRDEKTALIDTVKAPYTGDLLEHIQALTSLDKVDYIVCNHAEPDHAGGLTQVVKACPNAVVVCNQKCQKTLSLYQDTRAWKIQIVRDGGQISLGRRTLVFMDTPMVHWPESMFTYIPEEKLLFSMDAFGQHLAASNRFDDDEANDPNVVMNEAKTYYANIVMPYGKQVERVLERAAGLAIETIAPSHGVIWRKHIGDIIAAYKDWAVCKPQPKVLVVYDSMWQSTAAMARAIVDGASLPGVDTRLYSVRAGNITVLASEAIDAAVLAFGSPTLNMTMMPEMAAALTYLKGLRPAGKAGFAFGSYGWAKNGPAEVESVMKEMHIEILREMITAQYAPTAEALKECFEAGRALAAKALEMVKGIAR